MEFHFEYITLTVDSYFIDIQLAVNPETLLIQGKTQNSEIPTINGLYTLLDYVNFFSSLKNVKNLSLTIFLSLKGSAVMIYTGTVSVLTFDFRSDELRYTFLYNSDKVFYKGTKNRECSKTNMLGFVSDITYVVPVDGSISLGPFTDATQIKNLISVDALRFRYDYYYDIDYRAEGETIRLVESANCDGQTYTTNLRFSVYFVLSGDFKCDDQSLDTKPCQLVTACNENNKENCTKYFDMYRIRCQNELSSDFCYNFVQNFYSVEGPQSQMDNLIAQYCSNKNASQIFSKSQQNQRDFMLCGCHMNDTFYENFHKSVKQYTEDKGYEINESLFGQKEICLFPPCTLASDSFPAQGIGKCSNKTCFSIISYENDGTVKDGENITIIQDSKCFVKQNGVKAKAFLGFQTRQGLMLSDVFLLIIIVIITVVFVCILRFYRRSSNKRVQDFQIVSKRKI
jgi:hypothetical protein